MAALAVRQNSPILHRLICSIDWYARTREERVATVITTTLTKMAQGGVYDQLAGGFHRYSVDEHWTVPHFEKMSYDNSELLKNYVHAYQVFGYEFYAHVARDIIRWIDEWLSDREHAGFYASQDADINLDDDGDYFTWTVDEAKAALTDDEFKAIALHYDVEAVGEMHHNAEKNVLWVRALPEEVASRLGLDPSRALDLLASAKTKMYAARLLRPTPFVDKTVYVNWNAMCVSAYLQAAQVLDLDDARRFALRSLDRILAEAWNDKDGMSHVIAYADPQAVKRRVGGLLDDYAFSVLACLDAYEVTGAMSYFRQAQKIADQMIRRFHDSENGGFFDTEASLAEKLQLGALSARRSRFRMHRHLLEIRLRRSRYCVCLLTRTTLSIGRRPNRPSKSLPGPPSSSVSMRVVTGWPRRGCHDRIHRSSS